jgi:hypothetical protein
MVAVVGGGGKVPRGECSPMAWCCTALHRTGSHSVQHADMRPAKKTTAYFSSGAYSISFWIKSTWVSTIRRQQYLEAQSRRTQCE